MANFETANPLMMRLEPVGSASSIVYRMFKENNVEIPKDVAGLLLSGLISDTLLLKSPTTHASDPAVAEELARLAGVNFRKNMVLPCLRLVLIFLLNQLKNSLILMQNI